MACTCSTSRASAVTQTIDWNTAAIDWQGRGWDRGLRGIAFDGDVVYIAASDELFAYTPDFQLIGSWRNAYLRHCHEIAVHERRLFLTSTAFDTVLGFDLDAREFCWALHIATHQFQFKGNVFDPRLPDGPLPLNKLHLNSVHCTREGMYVTGLKTGGMLLLQRHPRADGGGAAARHPQCAAVSATACCSTTPRPTRSGTRAAAKAAKIAR